MRSLAIAIALAYGLFAIIPLGRRRLRQPWLLASFAGGALAFPVALALVNPIQLLFAQLFGWDMDAYSTGLGTGLLGVVVASAVNEVFKLAPALLISSAARAPGNELVFGAAAGAGYAVVGAHQVLRFALIARTLPISSSAGFASALVQQFAFVAMNTATTALAAYGTSRHRIGTYLLAAIAAESAFSTLGLLFFLRVYAGTVWTLAGAAVGFLLLAYTFVLSRAPQAPEGPTAGS